jgi:uncharacterized protein YjbI with pentapeptide repeats
MHDTRSIELDTLASWTIVANSRHLAKLKEGVDGWNLWRRENPEVRPVLGKADLMGANLGEAILARAVLKGADLSEANLRGNLTNRFSRE